MTTMGFLGYTLQSVNQNSTGAAKARSALENGKVAIDIPVFKYPRGPRNSVGKIAMSKSTDGKLQHTHETTKGKQGDVGFVLEANATCFHKC